jgi:hypothetical protein
MGGDLVSMHSTEENKDVLRWGSNFLDKVPMFFGGWLRPPRSAGALLGGARGWPLAGADWAQLVQPGTEPRRLQAAPGGSLSCGHLPALGPC